MAQLDLDAGDSAGASSGGRLRPRSAAKRLAADDPEEKSERFHCPEPGCKRTFAELWRLKVHCRASPDVRGSGRERGHGKELAFCPKCNEALQPGKHHIGCSAGRSAPRQAAKRFKTQMKANTYGANDSGLDLGRRHSTGVTGLPRMSSAASSGTFWHADLGSPNSRDQKRKQSRFSGAAGPDFGDQQALQFQSAYAQAWNQLRPGGPSMERHASAPLPRFQPFGLPADAEHGMGHYDPRLLQAAQAAQIPSRMESKGSSDLDMLGQPGGLAGAATGRAPPGQPAYTAGRSFSGPLPNSFLPPQLAVTRPQAELAGQLMQTSWGLPGFQAQGQQLNAGRQLSAFENVGLDGRGFSPQPRYPGDPLQVSVGEADGNHMLWGVKAAAASAAARPSFTQNAAAIRFLEQQRQLGGMSLPPEHQLYANATDFVSKGGLAASDAARLADQWGAEPLAAALAASAAARQAPKWDPLPQRDAAAAPSAVRANAAQHPPTGSNPSANGTEAPAMGRQASSSLDGGDADRHSNGLGNSNGLGIGSGNSGSAASLGKDLVGRTPSPLELAAAAAAAMEGGSNGSNGFGAAPASSAFGMMPSGGLGHGVGLSAPVGGGTGDAYADTSAFAL